MIHLDIDKIDIKRFELKMRKYPIKMTLYFQKLINRLTFISEKEILQAVRSGSTRAFDTGNLFQMISSKMSFLQGEIVSRAPYSLYVHSGTKYMRKRPYMTKGLDNSIRDFNYEIKRFLNKVLK